MAALPRLNSCCGCIDLRTGCMVIGCLHLVGQGFIILAIVSFMAILGSNEKKRNKDGFTTIQEIHKQYEHDSNTTIMIVLGAVLAVVIIILAFNVIFLVGINKSKRRYVKTFLIFYIIITVLNLGVYMTGDLTICIAGTVAILWNIYVLLVINSYYIKMGTNDNGQLINGPGVAGYNGPAFNGPVEAGYPAPYSTA